MAEFPESVAKGFFRSSWRIREPYGCPGFAQPRTAAAPAMTNRPDVLALHGLSRFESSPTDPLHQLLLIEDARALLDPPQR